MTATNPANSSASSEVTRDNTRPAGNNFIRNLMQTAIDAGDLAGNQVVTRFPPEPNGYLHLGHAKSICTNFGLANHFGGQCNLRFDDTNPEKESQEYIDAIRSDVKWLGFTWAGEVRYTSDYFDTLYRYAQHLIRNGDAYVDELSPEKIREYRGTLTEAGQNSPYRDRPVEESLALLEQMKAGERAQGSCCLRAKIDMSAGNINLRDPVIYRIKKVAHHQTGDTWNIYPSYDFAHGQSDALEGITHSLCTLEFEDHRPLYDWFLEHLPVPCKPRQIEFGRLNLNYTVTSKRKLKCLVDERHVASWDDPRMPTIAGLRRRGYTPQAIRDFCEAAGVARTDGIVDMSMLTHSIRNDLDKNAARGMCVLEPLKVVITNYPENHIEQLTAPGHPVREDFSQRTLPFTRELYIEQDDFREAANKKYKRLVLGKKVRLRNAYVLLAENVIKDDSGKITEVHCSYDPETLGANPTDGIKPKGVIHWVSATQGKRATVRVYDNLFTDPTPDRSDVDFLQHINPESLKVFENCVIEPGLATAEPETRFQFERQGYYVADRYDHQPGHPVFNRTVPLNDSFAKTSEPSNSNQPPRRRGS